jgi:hypothetical protein
MVQSMSTKAQAILEEFKALPVEERREVLVELQRSSVTDDVQRAAQRASIRRGRGLFAGSGLLEALLADRAKERARE